MSESNPHKETTLYYEPLLCYWRHDEGRDSIVSWEEEVER